MRRLIVFPCRDDTLVGSLDEGDGATGLLIVSGGNELRCGAHRGMAMLAADLAGSGVPVFRYDRRGIGDSTGENRGFDASGPDIAAAAAAFRAHAPHVTRIVGFGICDAATALACFHREAGIDALVLANPWVGDEGDGLPPAPAIRAHYARRAMDPRQWLRLAGGRIDIGKAVRGLRKASDRRPDPGNLIAARMGIALFGTPFTILLAERDNSAVRFARDWRHGGTIERIDSASHSFAAPGDAEWLRDRLRNALA